MFRKMLGTTKSMVSNLIKDATNDKCHIRFVQGPNFNTFYKALKG